MKSILVSFAVIAALLLAKLVLADGLAPITQAGAGAATSSPTLYLQQTFQVKQFGMCAPRDMTKGRYGCFGFGPGASGSPGTWWDFAGDGTPVGDNNYNVVSKATSAVANNNTQFALTMTGNSSSFGWAPAVNFGNFTASTSSNARIWISFTPAASFSALSGLPAALTSASSTLLFVGLAYDSGVSPNWLCCGGNGVSYGCASMNIAATSTLFAYGHNYGVSYLATGTTAAGPVACSIDGAGTSYSATTPAQIYSPTSPVVLVRTLVNSAITATYGWLTMETL